MPDGSPRLTAPTQVLLVPTTEVLLTHYDRDTGSSLADLASTDEFLASHVLRLPAPALAAPVPGAEGSISRENRAKAKQFTTVNGRTLVIKETLVYSNKGDLLHNLRVFMLRSFQASSI